MIFYVIAILIGLLILGAGFYYLVKEKKDGESRKIYGITTAAGAVIVLGAVIKLVVELL